MKEETFVVFGAGQMGRVIALDLARSDASEVVIVADSDEARAESVSSSLPGGKGRPVVLDAADRSKVTEIMRESICAIGAISYRVNADFSRWAIEAGCSYCDLGGNDEVVAEQLALDERARLAGVTILPNCGLAPGLANIIAVGGSDGFNEIDSIKIRVGGLPTRPRPPLNYQLVFSVEGLINEYSGNAVILRDGIIESVPALTEIEELSFLPDFPKLEAFHTSGGASRLPYLLKGRVGSLDYKTIRYPGHGQRMKNLFDLGFGSLDPIQVGRTMLTQRELFGHLLTAKLPSTGPDVVLLRVEIEGKSRVPLRKVFQLIDFPDPSDNISAMMRATAYPTSVIAQMIQAATIKRRGVITPEECVPLAPLLQALQDRGMNVTTSDHSKV